MRIIGGESRGRAIIAPQSHNIRPTSDRVREAIFNILEHGLDVPKITGTAIADIFAGTGALGLEALSRGAASACFVDNDKESIICCRKNAAAMGQQKNTIFLKLDACKLPPPPLAAKTPWSHVFLDPPYESGLLVPALSGLAAKGWIGEGSICIAETAAKEVFEPPDNFQVLDKRTYGAAKVTFLKFL